MDNEEQSFQNSDNVDFNNEEIEQVIDPEQLEAVEDEDMDMDDEEDERNDAEVRFTEHTGSIFAIALNPVYPSLAVTGGEDNRGFIWDITNGTPYAELGGHNESVVAVGFNITGDYAATADMDGIIKVWDVKNNGKLIITLEGPSEINWIGWHPKGNILIAGSQDCLVYMWLIPSGTLMQTFSSHQDGVSCGCFTPDGKNILSGSNDGSMILWNPKAGIPIYTIRSNNSQWHCNPITSLSVNKDNTLVVSGSSDGSLCISQLQSGKIIKRLEGHNDSVEDVKFCDCLPLIASASLDGTIRVWDINTYKVRHILNHDDGVIRIKWHANSPILTSCSNDKTVRMWDCRSGRCIKVWKGHSEGILDFDMTRDGKVMVTAGDDGESLVFMVDEE